MSKGCDVTVPPTSPSPVSDPSEASGSESAIPRPPKPTRVAGTRRSFFKWAGLAGAGGIAVVAGASILRSKPSSQISAPDVTLPPPTATLPGKPITFAEPTGLGIDGLSPFITPNDSFFRIDTAFYPPNVNLDTWRLKIEGSVNTPLEFSYDELLALPQVEVPLTIACVSNGVGGDLIGTAVWQGVPLGSLLERAGVQPTGDQIVGRSLDGFTAGFPTAAVFDGRTALLALGMNGEPLPPDHGFPARLVIEGLYGYVSATKWLSTIELTGWDTYNGYWIPLGWSKEGPVKIESRIDVPKSSGSLRAGAIPIAGVAWAPAGVARVEVQIDDGPWIDAQLGPAVSDGTWRQWVHQWQATAGAHKIRVRATDNDGQTQTSDEAPVQPDGATGWHTRRITVSA